MNRPLMNTLWLLGCKTILSAPIWYSLGVMIMLPQQRNALLLLTSWGIAGCCEHFASSISPALPAAPSSAGFNNILNARNTHRTLLCHWNLQMWKYHRTWARDWIQYDWWLVWIERAPTGCTSQGTTWLWAGLCALAGMWPDTATAGFRHGMLTSPPGAMCAGCAGAEGQSPASEDSFDLIWSWV